MSENTRLPDPEEFSRARPAGPTPSAPRPTGRGRWRRTIGAYVFLLPSITIFVSLILLPVICSAGLSFFDWGAKELDRASFHFLGLENFRELLTSSEFWFYTYNTLFLLMGLPVMIFVQLSVALLMNRKLGEVKVYRTIWFLPSVCAGVAIMLVWSWIYQTEGGLLNNLLACIGIQGPDWLGDPAWAKPAFITMTWWNQAGGMGMIMYLAALQQVPEVYYEASRIDGAGAWSRFWSITWPMVSPTTFFLLITGIIRGFQGGFMQAFVLTRGGPAGSTTTIGYYIYRSAFESYRLGYASAVAWVLFIVVAVLTIIIWRRGGRHVHY